LVEQVEKLNQGKYILRKGFDKDNSDFHEGEKLTFDIGAAAYPQPADGNLDRNTDYFIKKINKGATFGITQMIYSPKDFEAFLRMLKEKGCNVPILPGIRIITKMSQAEFLMKNFGINIPKEYLDILSKDNNEELIKQYIIDLIDQFRKAGAPGAHFFVMNEASIVSNIINTIK